MPQVVRPHGTRPELSGWSMSDALSVVSLLIAPVVIFCPHKTLEPSIGPLARGLVTIPGPLSELSFSGVQVIAEPAFKTVSIGEGNGAFYAKFWRTESNHSGFSLLCE